MKRKPNDVCSPDCTGRTETCHGTCEKYLAVYRTHRAIEAEYQKQAVIDDYSAKEVAKSRAGGRSSLAKYKPKGRW